VLKTERLLALALAALVALTLPAAPSHAADDAGGDYYYNAGRRVSIVRSPTRVALVTTDANARGLALERARGLDSVRDARDVKAGGVVELTLPSALQVSTEVRDIARSIGAPLVPVFYERGTERDASTLFITDEVLVRFRPDVSAETIAELGARHGVDVIESLRFAPNGFKLRVNSSDFDRNALTVANAFYETGLCLWAHPNFLASRSLRYVPNDTRYVNQWHLKNTGQGGGTVGADVKAEAAWDVTLGSTSISVAIADTGIDWHHQDLEVMVDGIAKIHSPRDVVHADNDPYPGGLDANTTHGSSCAGVSVEAGNNTLGGSGIAPKCRLVPIQLYAESTFTPNATEADAFTWAADHADIMSNSWGPDNAFTPLPDVTRDAIDYATTNGRGGKGTAVFFAAGNDNADINSTSNGIPYDSYSAYSGVIAVAASTNFDTKASYSSFGASISIAAPSSGGSRSINTTTFNGTNNGYTTGFGGTSSACPLAAGVGALVLSVNPNLTWRQLKSVLEQSADKVDVGSSFGQYDQFGHSNYYGFGRVNALRAVQLAVAGGPDTPAIYGAGNFFLRDSNSNGPANATFSFGAGGAGLVPLAGDWDGNGTTTVGLYDTATATFFLRNSNTPGPADLAFNFGPAGAVPIVGDWDGNGTTTIGIYIPASGAFFLKNANAPGDADNFFNYGPMASTLSPIVGDWNNDGIDSVGLYSQASGAFFLKNTNGPGSADSTFTYGAGGRVAVSGDWDNDGFDSIALYDTATGAFFLKNALGGGAADWVFTFGAGGATPLAGNWDGF
jgi:subtilisin family serine protease